MVTIVGTRAAVRAPRRPVRRGLARPRGRPARRARRPAGRRGGGGGARGGELTTPEEAWGNAAIPGFGIGKPVRAPELDPDADVPVRWRPSDAAADARARFDIAPDTLVLAASEGSPLAHRRGRARRRPWPASRARSSSGCWGRCSPSGRRSSAPWSLGRAARRDPGRRRRAVRGPARGRDRRVPRASSPTTRSSRCATGSRRRGRTSTSRSASGTTSCRTSSRPSAG